MLFSRINPSPGVLENTTSTFGRLQPALWARYSKRTRTNDLTEDGTFRFIDFDNWGDQADTATFMDGWKMHIDTGNSIVQRTTVPSGVLRLTTTTTDNNSNDLQYGGGVGNVAITSASAVAVAFDARIMLTQITNTYNLVCGLIGAGAAADNGFITDAGALADANFVGFNILEAAGATLKFTFKASGQTAATATVGTLAAATWYHIGFIFDPAEPNPAHRLIFYLDNTEIGYVSDATIAGATFPSAVVIGPGMCIKNQTNVGKSWDIDCMAWAMAG